MFTNKFDWRNDVRTWAEFVRIKAESGCTKSKAQLNALGFLIYMACDKSAKNQLDRAARSGLLELRGRKEDLNRTEVLEAIINIIARDSPTDSIKRLVDMLTNIHACIRKEEETPENFARRFSGLASEYIAHSATDKEDQDSQQFAIVLLRNARLPDSMMTTVIFQLMSQASFKPVDKELQTITVSTDKFQEIMDTCNTARNHLNEFDEQNTNLLITKLSNAIDTGNGIIKANQEDAEKITFTTRISLEDAVVALSQVEISSTENNPYCSISLLGKRDGRFFSNHHSKRAKQNIPQGQGLKVSNPCRACGKLGHWWKDRSDCREKMTRTFATQRESLQQVPANQQTGANHNSAQKSDGDASEPAKTTNSGGSFFRR